MDGIALCRALRRVSNRNYVYATILCARERIEDVVIGLAAGADDYLTKPVIEPELVVRLSRAKRIVALERSLRVANERNRLLALRHPLTEIYNRRYLMEHIPFEFRKASATDVHYPSLSVT